LKVTWIVTFIVLDAVYGVFRRRLGREVLIYVIAECYVVVEFWCYRNAATPVVLEVWMFRVETALFDVVLAAVQ
jgi:hypothetical protein